VSTERLSEHFTRDELACPCCGRCIVEPELISALERIRAMVGGPVIVNSGYRCSAHNRRIGGAHRSRHLEGRAADLAIPNGMTHEEFGNLCEEVIGDDGGVGRGTTFVHVDVRGYRARWR
jgi:uncharacterized protein YcbK (DUF882 family)